MQPRVATLRPANYHHVTIAVSITREFQRVIPALFQTRAGTVRLLHIGQGYLPGTDKPRVRINVQQRTPEVATSVPWALEMTAISAEEPSRLVRTLTGGILACGGWVLSRGASDTGVVNLLFEFERQACVDIYSLLIAAGLELSHNGHVRFTELCHCTRNHQRDCGTEIASVDLEIQTFPIEASAGTAPLQVA